MKTILKNRVFVLLVHLLMLTAVATNVNAQFFCSYGSFDDSTWGNWRKATGDRWGVTNTTLRDIYYAYTNPTNLPRRQFYIHGRGDTMRVAPFMPLVPPNGYKHAIHLGDEEAGTNSAQATPVNKISLETRVLDECFSFWYALRFDLQHDDNDDGAAFFMFRVLDSTGVNIIDSLTFYKESDRYDTFFTINTRYYQCRPWTEHRINMSGLVGKKVTLEFIVSDCLQQVHAGDAYLDNICFGTCCNSCDELFYWDKEVFLGDQNFRTITKDYETPTEICYQFSTLRFSYEIFKCTPYGVRVYDIDAPSITYSQFGTPDTPVIPYVTQTPGLLDFCVKKSRFINGRVRIGIEFTDAFGNVICNVVDTLETDACCSDAVVLKEPAIAGGECSGKIFFGIQQDPECDLADILISESNAVQDTRQGYKKGYAVPFCLTAGQTKTFTGYFINSSGDTLCRKDTSVSCGGVSCCDAVQVQLKHHTEPILWHPCCYQYHLNINPCYRCPDIYTVRELNGDTLLQGNNILSSIPPLEHPSLVRGHLCNNFSGPVIRMLELLDITGRIICTIPVEVPGCNDVPPIEPMLKGGNKQKLAGKAEMGTIADLDIQPNPADASIKVIFNTTEEHMCIVRITDISGRVVAEQNVLLFAGQSAKTYNTSEWANGIYILKVIEKENITVKKFIIEH